MRITAYDIQMYQISMEKARKNGAEADEFKRLGEELQENFYLTESQANAILNNRAWDILDILKN